MEHQVETEELRRRIQSALNRRVKTNPQGIPDPSADLALIDCDGPTGSLVFRYQTRPWMANIWGVVHGGVVANLVDTCMGMTCTMQCGVIVPTISMTVNYSRPVPLNEEVMVRVRTIHCGGTTGQMSAEILLAGQPDKPLVTASGAYCTKPNNLSNGRPLWDEE